MELQPITPRVIEVEPPQTRKAPPVKVGALQAQKMPEAPLEQNHPKKRRGLLTSISDMLFSLAMFMILLVVLTSGSGNGAPKKFFNYSYFTVVTPSMQDEIPQGSFILVKQVDPLELKEGDNITYMADQSTSVTHKILNIYENYGSSGARGFTTYGINNANPDEDIVYEANVVGKVIFVLPVAGAVLTKLGENVFLVFLIFGLCVLFSFLIRGLFVRAARPKIAR
jgi:signal peptidase